MFWMKTVCRGIAVAIATLGMICTGNAGYDLEANFSGRAYPIGGTFNLEGGYGFPVWGASAHKEGSPVYGYIRPGYQATTAITYNSGEVFVDLFPISLFGFRLGQEWVTNSKDYADYDCERLNCKGDFQKQFVEARLALGYRDVFFATRLRRTDLSSNDQTKNFPEEVMGLEAYQDGDQIEIITTALGVKLHPDWALLALNVYGQMDRLKGISRMTTINLSYRWDLYRILVGVGEFNSPLATRELTGLLIFSWTPNKRIGHF